MFPCPKYDQHTYDKHGQIVEFKTNQPAELMFQAEAMVSMLLTKSLAGHYTNETEGTENNCEQQLHQFISVGFQILCQIKKNKDTQAK